MVSIMSLQDSKAILAIDGGGTRCRFALVVDTKRFDCELGAANVFTDFEGAIRCIKLGVLQLSTVAGVEVKAIYNLPAYVGLAGANVEATRARLKQSLGFTVVEFEDDRNAAVRGAFGASDGFLAHCGTGSFFASQAAEARTFFGGWGPILGDEASACWMGKQALSAVLEHIDGRNPCPALAAAIMEELKDADGILSFAATATPEKFGAFAPYVTELATRGDPICVGILRAGALLVSQSLDRAGWQPGSPICLTGGLAREYGAYLSEEKTKALMEPLGPPIDGAIALAQKLQKDAQIGS